MSAIIRRARTFTRRDFQRGRCRSRLLVATYAQRHVDPPQPAPDRLEPATVLLGQVAAVVHGQAKQARPDTFGHTRLRLRNARVPIVRQHPRCPDPASPRAVCAAGWRLSKSYAARPPGRPGEPARDDRANREMTPAAAPETVLEGDTESGADKGRSWADRLEAAAPGQVSDGRPHRHPHGSA
jgi:hypothetical protein